MEICVSPSVPVIRRLLIFFVLFAGVQICTPAFASADLPQIQVTPSVIYNYNEGWYFCVSDIPDANVDDYILVYPATQAAGTGFQYIDPYESTYLGWQYDSSAGHSPGSTAVSNGCNALALAYTGSVGCNSSDPSYVAWLYTYWGAPIAKSNVFTCSYQQAGPPAAGGLSLLSLASEVGDGFALAWAFGFIVWGLTIPLRLMLKLVGIS